MEFNYAASSGGGDKWLKLQAEAAEYGLTAEFEQIKSENDQQLANLAAFEANWKEGLKQFGPDLSTAQAAFHEKAAQVQELTSQVLTDTKAMLATLEAFETGGSMPAQGPEGETTAFQASKEYQDHLAAEQKLDAAINRMKSEPNGSYTGPDLSAYLNTAEALAGKVAPPQAPKQQPRAVEMPKVTKYSPGVNLSRTFVAMAVVALVIGALTAVAAASLGKI